MNKAAQAVAVKPGPKSQQESGAGGPTPCENSLLLHSFGGRWMHQQSGRVHRLPNRQGVPFPAPFIQTGAAITKCQAESLLKTAGFGCFCSRNNVEYIRLLYVTIPCPGNIYMWSNCNSLGLFYN